MSDFFQQLKIQRWDDHRYYHHSRINQSLHLISAVSFVVSYALQFKDPALAALMAWLVSMTSRQAGHFFFEPLGFERGRLFFQIGDFTFQFGQALLARCVLFLFEHLALHL